MKNFERRLRGRMTLPPSNEFSHGMLLAFRVNLHSGQPIYLGNPRLFAAQGGDTRFL
jgi:hypothetical protein